jgi:hypothetical protein
MREFSHSTGLSDTSRKPRRYLWTDAFAVCNFLELYRKTGEEGYLQSARKLVEQVHVVLGRYGDEDSRSGWLSGLDEKAGYQHPTRGGLRIGKQLPEREPEEPFDDRLEWDRDGQYFHYLTKWMQALTRMAAVTGEPRYQHWALELARAAHAGFTYSPAPGASRRMYWKMSIDLSRPLVASMGHHDPLDALITYMELKACSGRLGIPPGEVDLDNAIADCQAMCAGNSWATDDPLGTGGLMVDAFRLAQIQALSDYPLPLEPTNLLADCEAGLEAFVRSGSLAYPATYRLPFRELGLTIGLHAIAGLRNLIEASPGGLAQAGAPGTALEGIHRFARLASEIEDFWLQPAQRHVATWRDHLDINSVMLATSLAPDTYLNVIPSGLAARRHSK